MQSSAHHCSRPTWICNTYINTALSRVQRRTVGEGSTVIAPKHQPLISLKTNWCSMLTSFTLISGIKKNTGCNAWRQGWERGSGWAAGLRKLSTNVASNHWWKGKAGEKEREKGTVQRKSQVAGVREETERIEARRNRGIGRRKEETGEGGCARVCMWKRIYLWRWHISLTCAGMYTELTRISPETPAWPLPKSVSSPPLRMQRS